MGDFFGGGDSDSDDDSSEGSESSWVICAEEVRLFMYSCKHQF